jgi:glycosyltransferase involved in cell wall biosynthesis
VKRPGRYDVCAAVVSHLPFDARVWKEARTLADAGYRVLAVGARYEVERSERRREGLVDVIEIRFGTRDRPLSRRQRMRTLLGIWTAVLRTRARVYHAHNIHTGPVAWLASRLNRAKLVYDGHEIYGEIGPTAPLEGRLPALVSLLVERFMVRHADVVVTTNESRAKVLRERHGVDRIHVIGNVPQVVAEVVPVNPGYPADRHILLYQGGVYARSRAFQETVQALRILDDTDLVVIGFGRRQEIELVQRWAKLAGVAEQVHFLGPRKFDELIGTAAAATVGLVPIKPDSLNHYFGDTNKLFEYLMAGLPVVASDLPEIRRVVTSGTPHVGELFEPGSPESIASAVRRIVDDPASYAARRAQARAVALRSFNWEIEGRRLLGLYSNLTANGGGTVGRCGVA